MLRLFFAASIGCLVIACGPTSREACSGADCSSGPCNPSDTRACYDGQMGTEGVGPCVGGQQTCQASGQWGSCVGEVVPVGEICGDHIDNNCNGMVDEDVDEDGDGWTTCQGDCCDSTECANPALVNPGAYDVPGDGVDNDCDGMIDNAPLSCDQGLTTTSTNGLDFAKAIDICQTTTTNDPLRHWGVIDATFSLADGTGTANAKSHAILPHYGTGTTPQGGVNLMLISNGNAAGKNDPNYDSSISASMGTYSAWPSDFVSAHGNTLPNAPGCPSPASQAMCDNGSHSISGGGCDPIMLTMHIRVPTNANSFSLDTNFFSDEFPEYTCSQYNDFFVVLLDSMYSGTPANPTDKNLAFYTSGTNNYPVGVNLAYGNTGLFTQCVNGTVGCDGTAGTITTCTGVTELAGTGLDQPAPFACDTNSLMGGGTGWLTTSGNVTPGEIMTLRIAIWDTSDDVLDSLAAIDGFKWAAEASQPGTVIFRGKAPGAADDRRAHEPERPGSRSRNATFARARLRALRRARPAWPRARRGPRVARQVTTSRATRSRTD